MAKENEIDKSNRVSVVALWVLVVALWFLSGAVGLLVNSKAFFGFVVIVATIMTIIAIVRFNSENIKAIYGANEKPAPPKQ